MAYKSSFTGAQIDSALRNMSVFDPKSANAVYCPEGWSLYPENQNEYSPYIMMDDEKFDTKNPFQTVPLDDKEKLKRLGLDAFTNGSDIFTETLVPVVLYTFVENSSNHLIPWFLESSTSSDGGKKLVLKYVSAVVSDTFNKPVSFILSLEINSLSGSFYIRFSYAEDNSDYILSLPREFLVVRPSDFDTFEAYNAATDTVFNDRTGAIRIDREFIGLIDRAFPGSSSLEVFESLLDINDGASSPPDKIKLHFSFDKRISDDNLFDRYPVLSLDLFGQSCSRGRTHYFYKSPCFVDMGRFPEAAFVLRISFVEDDRDSIFLTGATFDDNYVNLSEIFGHYAV